VAAATGSVGARVIGLNGGEARSGSVLTFRGP
jgi:hypothetical protein